MKQLAFIISILVLLVWCSTNLNSQAVGLKMGYLGGNLGYDRYTSGNYVSETEDDGKFIAVPFQYQLNKYFSLSTELGFAARKSHINHQFLISSANGQELKTVLRAIKTNSVYLPLDANLHIPWKGFKWIFSTGIHLAQNTGTTVYDNEEAIQSGNGIRLPKDLRMKHLQSGWTVRGGLQYPFNRFTLMGDIRLARTFARYAQEYEFDNVPNLSSKIFTGTAGIGILYHLN